MSSSQSQMSAGHEGPSSAAVKLTENQRDVLETLDYTNHRSSYPRAWATPLDLGASNGSHHSGTLAALAKKGLVQFKQRGAEEPPEGENGKKRFRGRGSKSYRVTAAGREAAALLRGDRQ